ncbi:1-acyl-sn-glycerol-3-phosphate acyltransferase [Nocardioides guangzhouensis]|uniref:1-acyl-sn-glycerol-3-phosphate acyltransferase n=1 Tax=Nocardioides guangzhouensis TaxID=2497878 RepID=A0A4V1XYE2_9ACTN|nr:lysophospholipid acyltransferase family protein [Nocardioides guangzhouensis]RYP82939.1 1-acyl-sn-glycerol-3-phosphate acyltransferase [Nocardioides guangzhouensis]
MSDRVYRAATVVGRGVLRVLDVRVRVAGSGHLPTDGPVLLAANHASYADFVLLARAAVERDRHVRFLCRHDAWQAPGVGWLMDRMGHVPVDREAPAGAYLHARRLLRSGEAVGVFPEAGISWSYAVRPLMRGVAALARDTGVPVLPVAMWGGQRIWTVGRTESGREPWPSLRRGRLVDVRFGAPLQVAADDDLTAWTRSLGEVLTAMLEDVQRLPEHRPRAGERAPWYPQHLGGHAPDVAEARTLDDVPRRAVPPSWGPWVRPGPSRAGAPQPPRPEQPPPPYDARPGPGAAS